MFDWWAKTYHRGVYLYPLFRACGGDRQDGATEAVGRILGNIPIYLEFIAWRFMCGGGNGILEKKCFILIALLSLLPSFVYWQSAR